MTAAELLEIGGMRRTPLICQSEAAECGLACLAMIAGYHRLETDMPAMRRRFSLSLKGTTLKDLMHIAEQIGFTTRPLRCEIDALEELPLPAMLHWELKHFVVLTKVKRGLKGRRYHLHDPAQGTRILTEAELSRCFTGVVLELLPSEHFKPRREASKLRIVQLWSRMSGLWASLRRILLLSVVLQLIALASPFYLQLAVDTVFPSFDTDLLRMLALGFGGLLLINMLTAWLRSLMLVTLGNSLSYQVIVNLFRHLMRLPLPWFEKRHVGDVISRFGSTQPISTLLSQGLIAAIIDGAMASLTLTLMLVYSPLLALVALVAWLVFAGLKIVFYRSLKMRNLDVIATAARENSAFIESMRGISAIKAFGQERNRLRLWQQLKADAVNAQIKLGRLSAGFEAGGQFILGLERVIFVYAAVGMAMVGDFTVGMIFAFQAYKQQFLDASTRLVDAALNFRLLDVHLNRIADIALAAPEEDGSNGAELRSLPLGGIELREVSFSYGLGQPQILRGVNLKIAAGDMVVLVGPSGGGKTTLLKIMMGLFEPGHGRVLVDGKPLASIKLPAWRRLIGSVSQGDALFAGSLAENIAFFDPEIDMERVVAAARKAAIHEDIAAMPMGYETLVGDMGSSLSGGQRQRVLLARALYPNPVVLFIDEGTANLDALSEASVLAAIAALSITRIMSAHRAAPVQAASRLFVVAGGTVAPATPPAATVPDPTSPHQMGERR